MALELWRTSACAEMLPGKYMQLVQASRCEVNAQQQQVTGTGMRAKL